MTDQQYPPRPRPEQPGHPRPPRGGQPYGERQHGGYGTPYGGHDGYGQYGDGYGGGRDTRDPYGPHAASGGSYGAQGSPYDPAYGPYDPVHDPAHGEAYGAGGYGGDGYGDGYGGAPGGQAYGDPGAHRAAPPPPRQHHGGHPGPAAPQPGPGGEAWSGGGAAGGDGTARASGAPAATATAGAPSAPSGPAPRTGDPIIPPGMTPAALTAVLCALLAATAQLSRPVSAVAVVLLQAVTAAGWYRLNGMWPARQGIALAFLGGVAADIALLAAGADRAPAVILGTLGVWCLLVIVLQLRNHSSPDERLYALTAGVASAALTVLATGHLAAEPDAVTAGALAVAAATLARALPLPSAVSVAAAVAAAAGAGVAAGQFTSLGAAGAVLGLAAGVCALVGLRVASYDFPSRFVHMTAGVALPLTAAVPAVYLLGRALA